MEPRLREWDGQRWTDVTPGWGSGPLPRRYHAAAHAAGRRCVVQHGGEMLGHVRDDTWYFDADPDRTPALRFTVGLDFPGADLLAWDAFSSEWTELAANASGPDAPSDLSWRSPSADAARRLLLQRDRELSFLLRPGTGMGNGPSTAEVAADYLEAEIRYSWPLEADP